MALISISGRKGSGKDLVGRIIQMSTANYTVHEIHNILTDKECKDCDLLPFSDETNWQIKKFANPLKDMVCILLNCTREQLEDRHLKTLSLQELANMGVISKEFVNSLNDD